jgi:hypothetical protein
LKRLPNERIPPAHFAVVDLGGERVLRVDSERGYANLVHRLPGVGAGVLGWRWRVDVAPAGANLTRREGDDTAIKVCALFDMPFERVPFLERALLRLASLLTRETLPAAVLCYVWDANLPADTLLRNPYTARVRYLTSRGTPGQWRDERHDLAADFLRAFGDESRDVPPLVAIAIGADTDNTGSRSLAYLDGLRLDMQP